MVIWHNMAQSWALDDLPKRTESHPPFLWKTASYLMVPMECGKSYHKKPMLSFIRCLVWTGDGINIVISHSCCWSTRGWPFNLLWRHRRFDVLEWIAMLKNRLQENLWLKHVETSVFPAIDDHNFGHTRVCKPSSDKPTCHMVNVTLIYITLQHMEFFP